MELVFDDEAIADLESIRSWIAQDSPAAAENVVGRLFDSTQLLTSFPLMGHAGRAPNTFEWVVPRLPYTWSMNSTTQQTGLSLRRCFIEPRIGIAISHKRGIGLPRFSSFSPKNA
jgi:toxin ParE1/3/4